MKIAATIFPLFSYVRKKNSRSAQENEQHIFKRNHPLASQMLVATAGCSLAPDSFTLLLARLVWLRPR